MQEVATRHFAAGQARNIAEADSEARQIVSFCGELSLAHQGAQFKVDFHVDGTWQQSTATCPNLGRGCNEIQGRGLKLALPVLGKIFFVNACRS